MRVIFLDIDGVLNSERHARAMEARHYALGHIEPARPKRETTCDCFQLYKHVDREAVARLNRIIAESGAKIVISSSWRKRLDLSELRTILGAHGLVGEVVDATPDGHKHPELREALGYPSRIFRGHEIDFWLRQHPDVDRFVILDDDSDMEMHKKRLVQTDCAEGLLDEHVELAIRVLSWDGTSSPSPMDELEAASGGDGMRDFGWKMKAERLRMVILSVGHQLARELPPGIARILEVLSRVAKTGDGSGLQEEIAAVPQDEHKLLWEPLELCGWKIEATMYFRDSQLWWLVHAERKNERAPTEKDIAVLDKVLGHLGAEPVHHAIIGPCSSPPGEPPLPFGWWTWRNGWLLYEIQINKDKKRDDDKIRIVPLGTRETDGYTSIPARDFAAEDGSEEPR